jgi:PHD/YefM family antitoxin component YafN of YafNO toxin-antitoxin module
MVRTISAPKTDVKFDDLIDSLAEGDEPVLVERDGKPIAVVIAPATYERLVRLERERDWAVIDRLRALNADKDPDQVFADVTAEVESVRRDRRSVGD